MNIMHSIDKEISTEGKATSRNDSAKWLNFEHNVTESRYLKHNRSIMPNCKKN